MMGKKSKEPAQVSSGQTVSEVLARILKHNFQYSVTWESAARSWDDIEGVHQMRVSFRRMRSALSAFRAAVPKPVAAYWSEELRALGNGLGMARDLDVFIDEGLGSVRDKLPLPGQDKMLRIAEDHRARAYEEVRTMLDSDRYAAFKRDFPKWLDSRAWEHGELEKKERERLLSPVLPFARKLLDRQERKVLQAGTHVNRDSADEMHQLRIECKKLRYAAEFFAPIFKGLDDFISHMKGLQDLLGVMNDVSVMQNLLETLLADTNDPEVLQYAGGLVGWRTRHFYELLDGFDDRWEEFTHAKHPWWSKHSTSP